MFEIAYICALTVYLAWLSNESPSMAAFCLAVLLVVETYLHYRMRELLDESMSQVEIE